MTRYSCRLFSPQYPACRGRFVCPQALPNGALGDANDTAERRLATSELDSFCERFGRGDFTRHSLKL